MAAGVGTTANILALHKPHQIGTEPKIKIMRCITPARMSGAARPRTPAHRHPIKLGKTPSMSRPGHGADLTRARLSYSTLPRLQTLEADMRAPSWEDDEEHRKSVTGVVVVSAPILATTAWVTRVRL
jgi:hypothetical protein